ncbi:MAG: hypothetical protein A2145_04260 [candidate division Zixibacteria bacterium RBG_16_40_9]|nr:MAG: hypothetical protein A2145_04260 [candidate division Zixibacteria bacterium RBG_16_40_9]
MFSLTLKELGKFANGKALREAQNGNGETIQGISIDSRTLEKGNLFVALEGEKFDGHDFIQEAVNKGAKAVIVEKRKLNKLPENLTVPVGLVEDSKKTLQELAKWYRQKLNLKVVAVTGTNGKTTTKEMIAQVLSTKYKVLKAKESFNNLVGVPLSIFEFSEETQVAVLELGMSNLGEIAQLTKIAGPCVGVITNIGPAHLESLHSLEKIAQAKFELLDNLPPDKTVVLNIDDPFIQEKIKRERHKVISYGIKNKADFQAHEVLITGNGHIDFKLNKKIPARLNLLGYHNVYNALAAIAVANLFKIEPEKAIEALNNYHPAKFRMETVKVGGINLINDSYNANPTSMQTALESLVQIKSEGKKVAVLGDMLELGEQSDAFHQEMGQKAVALGIDLLITVGNLANHIASGARQAGLAEVKIFSFSDNNSAVQFLLENLKPGDWVLIKGSRKMKMEEIVLGLQNLYSNQS